MGEVGEEEEQLQLKQYKEMRSEKWMGLQTGDYCF